MNAPNAQRAIEAEVNYMQPMAERPYIYLYTPPDGRPARNGKIEPRRVTIRDARPMAASLSLDVEGFALMSQTPQMRDYYDNAEVERVAYPEAIELVKQATGAVRAVIFDHTLRRRAPGRPPITKRQDSENGVRGPVPFAHNDYTPKSGPQRVRDLMGDEAEDLLTRRFAIVNIWRPIKGPVVDAPLGLCDARTLADSDMIATDLVYEDRTGEIYYAVYNPAHEWFYLPDLRTDEAILIKTFDSRTDGTARWSLHSAFEDPTTPADAAPRESIELRSLIFFAD